MVNQFQGGFFPICEGEKKSELIDLQKSFVVSEKLFVKMKKPLLPPPVLFSLFKGVIHTMS